MARNDVRLETFDRVLIALSMVLWYVIGIVGALLVAFGSVDRPSRTESYEAAALAVYWSSPLIGAVITRLLTRRRRPFSVLAVTETAVLLLGGAEIANTVLFPGGFPSSAQRQSDYHLVTWALRIGAVATGSVLGIFLGERLFNPRGTSTKPGPHGAV